VAAGDGAAEAAFAVDPITVATVLEYAELHPQASPAQIRKALRLKKSVVDRILREGDPA